MAGELEASLYLAVTAFGLTAGVAALKSQEESATRRLKDRVPDDRLNDPKVLKLLEEPARWALYSVTLFVASGFVFLVYFLVPAAFLGPEDFPTFLGAMYLYVLAFCYFLILFAFTVFTKSRQVFNLAHTIGRALRVGMAFALVQWVVFFELIPATILAATFIDAARSGLSGITDEGLVFDISTILSIVGSIALVWTGIDYLRSKARRFDNRQLGLSIILFLLPFLAYLVFQLPSAI
ncbi:MAG: hypothetical protein KGI38_00570 [Thaumarchaeota archaeon]|nr:hypothetical protein [Nitrososphaerota archaeon]